MKKGQKNAKIWRTCQIPFFHAKQLLKRPNFGNLALKSQPGSPGPILPHQEQIHADKPGVPN